MAKVTTVVDTIPGCDMPGCDDPAYADAAVPGQGWGYWCEAHFDRLGCGLGLGRGQKLLKRSDVHAQAHAHYNRGLITASERDRELAR